jgi:hypothetical protein
MRSSADRRRPFANPVTRLAVAGILVLVVAVATAPPAQAQVSSAMAINTDPRVNGRHLQDAVTLGQSALERLQGPRAVDELASIHQTIDLMYRTVRLALFGMREQKRRLKFDDPIVDYQLGRTGKAWDTIRGSVDRYFDSLPPEVYIAKSIPELQEAIRLLRPVAAVMQ